MKVVHLHFGKDGGAERFFVHLVNALHRRGVEQVSVIRPQRIWRPEIAGASRLIESHFRDASPARLIMPLRVAHLARTWKPNAFLAWMPKASKLLPKRPGCIRLTRLGDYPLRLRHFDNADVLVCNTPGIAQRVKDLGWTRGVEVITNFTDASRAAPAARQSVGTPADAFVVSTMGRFVPRKGFDTLIDAAARDSRVWLWIMGDGDIADDLKAQAARLGVAERVKFLGWQADTRPFVAASDVFAMPSRHEPLGNVILEAWAQGVPVVSSRSEGPSWFMRDGQNGLMVDIDDAEGFATAFDRLRSDGALRSRLVEGGADTLQRQFSRDAITDAYLDLFSRKP